MYNNSSFIGSIGEAVAIAEFTKRGIPVSKPIADNLPYDLIIDVNNILYKVQCKTTKNVRNGMMQFHIDRTNGFTGDHSTYDINEIDYYFLYCIENCYCGLISLKEVYGQKCVNIRLIKPLNNQFNSVRFYTTYSIDNQLPLLQNIKIHPFYFLLY